MRISKIIAGINVDYEENFWTGKFNLSFNSVPLFKVNRKTFIFSQNNTKRTVTLKGNFISGIKMHIDGFEDVYHLLKYAFYEKFMIFMPTLGFLLGIFCGAIFAAVSGICSFTTMVLNAKMMQSKMSVFFKVLLALSLFIIITFAWFYLYLIFLNAITPIIID